MTSVWRRRADQLLGRSSGSGRSGGAERRSRVQAPDGPTPLELALKRQWARRELYTARIGQAALDLSQSPLAPGGNVFTAVPIEGPEIVATYRAGTLVLEATGAPISQTHYRVFGLQPFATVEADLEIFASVQGTAMIEWRSGDGARRLTVAAHRHAGTISAELSVAGCVVASTDETAAELSGPFTLIAQLQGRSVLIWHRIGRETTYVGRLDFGAQLDLRDPAEFSSWTLGLTARGHTDLQVRCSRFETHLSGNGHADPRIVCYEDGTPIQDAGTVWFLATARGGTIPDAFQGVFALDVHSGRITMTGALFGDRGDGVWRNDNAGQLLFDRDRRRWSWLAIGHSDHPHPRDNWVAESELDLRFGVHTVSVSRVELPPGGQLWEDMYAVRDGGRWIATASRNATNTAWLESTGGLVGPWVETRGAVGTNETGQLLVTAGGHRYLVAGTDTAAYVVRDAEVAAMTELGHLEVDVDTGGRRVWPALFALEQPPGLRWFMLTFDRTSPAEPYSYGRLHFYRQT